MVRVYDDRVCVLHAHADTGGPHDAPPGTPIKCWSFAKYGKKKAIAKAHAMHYAIILSERRARGQSA